MSPEALITDTEWRRMDDQMAEMRIIRDKFGEDAWHRRLTEGDR